MPSSAPGSHAIFGRAERLLHRVTLGSPAVTETAFDLEQAMFGRQAAAIPLGVPVFVCGLARAGTSLVTRLLESSGAFATPTYRDMPVPLAPNLWARLSGGARRSVAATERSHGDGLTHDLDSPEAIEEVFWRCFEGDAYLRSEGLAPVPPHGETIANYRRYVATVALRRGQRRYLAKNNNNILRLPALLEAFPHALFVHPFRAPADQAESLRHQHQRACALQAGDRFRRDYMAWLGHHEFGAGQRPFLLPGAPDDALDRADLAYWRQSWDSVHAWLLDQPPAVRARQLFVDIDALRADPAAGTAALAAALGIEALDSAMIRPSGTVPSAEPGIHAQLRALAL